MKRRGLVLVLAIAMAISAAGCGSGAKSASTDSFMVDSVEEAAYDFDSSYSNGAAFSGADYKESDVPDTTRKLITTIDISGETKEFDATVETIRESVKSLGGYVESGNVSGRSSYYDDYYTRDAYFTVRIPENKVEEFVTTVNGLCNVTRSSENVEDVSLTYADTETHVKVLNTEKAKLEEMLEACETIEDMIAVEQRLSEVVAELEIYASRLRTYDNLINYSTITISISEVRDYTVVVDQPKNVWQEIGTGFLGSVKTIRNAAVSLFVFLVSNILYILIIALIAFVIKKFVKKDKRKLVKKESTTNTEKEQDS